MKKQTTTAALRQKAEAILKTRTDVTHNISTDADILKLIHEIEVHQIEMELQNEELRQAKQQAELAAEKYSDLYDFAPLGHFSLSEEGKIIELNLAGARMLGKERSRLQNISFGHFVSHESKPAFNRFLAEASRGTANVTCEVALAANGGNPMFVSLTGARDESRERYLVTAVDISKHKKEEALLRIKEYDLKESQRIAHVGSWRLDLKTNEVLWTEELYNMYGFDSSVPPPPYTEHMKLFTPESWERLSTALAHTRKTGIPYTLELETIRKDGTNGWMWVRGETEVDDTGKTVALWGAAQDITERKIAENEILWRNDDLQLMNSITVAANNNKDLGSIIELISAQLRKTFSSHLISIFLPDVENRELRMYGNKLDYELINKIEKVMGRAIPEIRLKMDGEHPFTEVERSLTGLLFVGKKALTNRLAGYLIGTPWSAMVQKFVKKLLPLLCDIIDYQSSVAVPLISNGIIAGYLELGSRKILTDNDLNRIQAIANQLASVIARKESNKKLRKSEQIMSSAFNFAAIGMAFVSPEGRWLKVNAAVLAMLGYTEAELMSKNFQEITHPDDLGKDLNYVRQMLEGTIQTYQMEKRYFHKSGSIIWILLSVSLVSDEQGHPLHFISQIQDITERKLAESKLKESEEKYRSIFESVQEVYFEASMDGTLHEVSPSIEVITKGHFKRDEMIGQSFAGIYENSRERDVYFSRLFEQKRVNDYELRLKNKDGSIIHCAISSALSFDASGNPVKITGILRDITERKNAENALKVTLEQLNQAKLYLEERVEERTKEILEISGLQKAILENAPIAIMTINEQGVYQSINPAGEKMLGYSAGEVIGKLDPFSFHDKDEMLRICFEMTAKSNPTDEELFHAVLQ